jgi:hypothetical protein
MAVPLTVEVNGIIALVVAFWWQSVRALWLSVSRAGDLPAAPAGGG